jgi:hypothetical protein
LTIKEFYGIIKTPKREERNEVNKMTYKCLECDHIFEEGEEALWEEDHGFSEPPYEKMSGCPLCYGAYEKTEQCKVCGSHCLERELISGVCEECIDGCKNNLDVCLAISEKDTKENININPLIYLLIGDEAEIEYVLMEYIKSQKNVDCSDYIDKDVSWFAEQLVKEVNKREDTKD